jgi:hypothetical protein
MIATVVVLAPLAILAAWVFLRLSPAHGDGLTVRRFNVVSLLLVLLLVVAWAMRTRAAMAATPDAAWWPIVASFGALLIVPVALAVAGVVRNGLVFRSRPGRSRH